MNSKEFKCVDILTDLVENYGLVGIKTSFEDEGASFIETIRLKEICNQSKTKLTIKISGPEAIRDLVDATTIGVKGIVAPMIESPFALKKFIDATQKNIEETALQSIQLGINIETITAVSNISNILDQTEAKSLYNLTIGRVDLVSSLNQNRSYVNSKEIYDMTTECFENAKKIGLKLCVGGAISIESEEFLNNLYENRLLDKFETRYTIYDASALKNFRQALAKGQLFEYEWLQTKRQNYQNLADKDSSRIQMIQNRINSNL
jgi:4-hydroxy-2-oxoheptanedioate aldolase